MNYSYFECKIKLLFLSLVYLNLIKHVKPENVGDACIDSNSSNGTCQVISTCPQIEQQKINGEAYSKCGLNNEPEIACCAQETIFSFKKANTSLLRSAPRQYDQQCEEHKASLFDSDWSKSKNSAESLPINKTSCWQNYMIPVINGENACPKEFPHMALIGCQGQNGKYNWGCGGSLISPYYVLTAAHCFEPTSRCSNAAFDIVRLGDLNIEIDDDDAQPKDFKIDKVISYPSYNSSIKYNDIALIKLANKVNFNSYIRPACLPNTEYNNKSQLIVTGWGHTLQGGKYAAHLQKAAVELFPHEKCNEIYSEEGVSSLPNGIIEAIQMCAGSYKDENDTCQGDSGGPLQTFHPGFHGMYLIVGITSYGQACGIPGIPGVYTRVYHYIDWIESVVWG